MSEEKESKSVESPLGKFLNNKPTPLRQPNCSGEEGSVASSGDNSGNEPEDVEQNNIINKIDGGVLNSTLNVNAAEFIPYSQQNQRRTTLEDIHAYLRHELHCLALTPGKYDEIFEALCDVLCPFQEDEEVVKSVINIILNECITEQNLCYTGARLCTDLQKTFGTSFRKYLLSSCEREYSNFMSNQALLMDRMYGFGLVLAELYLQIDIQEKRISILGDALFDLLNVLLKNEGEKPIKCICQILKLTGVMLEEHSESSSAKMDELFSRLRVIIQYPDLDPNLRFTINNVIQMRESNWGRNKSQESSSVVAPVNANGYEDIIFFGPDGEIITDEEKSFLHDNLPSSDDVDDLCDQDSMDEEMFNAYEEFLKLKEAAEHTK